MAQASIKLNRKKYMPLLDDIKAQGFYKTDSEAVAGCIWLVHTCLVADEFGCAASMLRALARSLEVKNADLTLGQLYKRFCKFHYLDSNNQHPSRV